MKPIAKHYLVTGRVQRVYFRQSTLAEARRLGITGWVRNLPDGQVEAVACGEAAAMQQFEAWIRVGPPQARVDKVVSELITLEELPTEFSQRATPVTG